MTFSYTKSATPGANTQNKVSIHKVVTEGDVVSHSSQLEHALQNRQFAEFCSLKISNSEGHLEETLWKFLKVRNPQALRVVVCSVVYSAV